MDYSAINYYVEAYAFTNWMKDRLGGTLRPAVVFDEATNTYRLPKSTGEDDITGLFEISKENDIEVEDTLISEHKKQIMMNSINSNLNVSISNYAHNTAGSYRLPVFRYEDWNQIFKNISMIAFFQGVTIGLKTYNNYAIATSSLNRDYVDPDGLYFASKSTSFHRPYCTHVTLDNIKETYKGYRSVEYTLKSSTGENGEIYYYQHTEQPTTTDTSDLGCYYCIVNKANYEKTIDKNTLTAEEKDIKNIQIKAYKEALARERYYQDVTLDEDLDITISYNENIPTAAVEMGLVKSISNMPANQKTKPEIYTKISDKLPIITTNDSKIELVCTGWSTDKYADVRTYEPGGSYYFTDDVDLYAIWSLALEGLDWIMDYYWTWGRSYFDPDGCNVAKVNDGSISNIRMIDGGGGATIEMEGNGTSAGKGATWTTIDSEYLKIKEFKFDFDVVRGDSFNAAGLMFNVKQTGNVLTGYLFSINFAYNGSFANIGKAAICEFTYNIGQNNLNFERVSKIQSFDIRTTGSGRSERFTGSGAI